MHNNHTIQFMDYISTFQLKFTSNLSAIRKIGHVVFRMRLFSVDNKFSKEFNKICHIQSTSPKIPFERKCKFHKASIIGLEIELLHFRYNGNVADLLPIWRFWTKWNYPFDEDVFDKQLYEKDSYFNQEFEKICFGVNGKYYILQCPEWLTLWWTIRHFAEDYEIDIKYGYLSKVQDILVSTGNATNFCPKFKNLQRHYRRVKEEIEGKLEKYDKDYWYHLEFIRESVKTLKTRLNTLQMLYQSIQQFHRLSSRRLEKRTIISMASVGHYDIVKSNDINPIDMLMTNPKQHQPKNRYHYLNKRCIQNHKKYRNNKKKYQYNRW